VNSLNFEEALVEELGSIQGLEGRIYPLNAGEGEKPPFVVYVSSEGEQDLSLEGFANTKEINCEIHIVCDQYEDLKNYTKAVLNTFLTFQGRPIGTNGPLIKSFAYDHPQESNDEERNYSVSSFDIRVRL
jgi:hypothetical protein